MDHGASILPDGLVRFRVWSPSERHMRISIDGAEPVDMRREVGDWFRLEAPGGAGTRYSYVLGDGLHVPDPTSRLQEDNVHGASIVVDPLAFEWKHDFSGRPWRETVLYEAHPGAMGGFAGLTEALPHLARTGITALELMPIAEFPGRHNWGYDGVLPYAPDTAYGTPDQLKRLIDTAHGLGIMMFLDVVYNHFGPDGAYIHIYAKQFFTEDFHTPWGAGIDFRRNVVQEYFIHNALYWLREYRFDGLRFDALGAIEPQEFLFTLASRIRAGAEPGRYVHLVMEHECNAARLLRGAFDAQWTDDIHHALHVLLTGETFGYYEDFEDATGLLVKSLIAGFAYQGEVSKHSGKPRGENSTDLPTSCFVAFTQNHDQIGNRASGDRMSATVEPARLRVARAFLLLSPFIPLLFMGEEWASKRPFQFFTDHHDELAELVRNGRRQEFAAFFGDKADELVPDPNHVDTFNASRIDLAEADQPGYREELALTRYLLALRAQHIAPRLADAHAIAARALGRAAVLGEWALEGGITLRIALNLGSEDAMLDPTDMKLLYVSDDAAGSAARRGSLPARAIAVWLGGLAEDVPVAWDRVRVSDDALRALAEAAGVAPRWRDAFGQLQEVSPHSLKLVLTALEVPAGTETEVRDSLARLREGPAPAAAPPLVTADINAAISTAGASGRYRITLEHGGVLEGDVTAAGGSVSLPAIDVAGYHTLELGDVRTTLAVAPPRCFGVRDADPAGRLWGLAAQLYSLRRRGDGGIGDFAALREFVEHAARRGADAVAISPIHAQFSADPDRFSPYSPSSRVQVNVLHADVDELLGIDTDPASVAFEHLKLVDWPGAGRARLARFRTAFAAFSG